MKFITVQVAVETIKGKASCSTSRPPHGRAHQDVASADGKGEAGMAIEDGRRGGWGRKDFLSSSDRAKAERQPGTGQFFCEKTHYATDSIRKIDLSLSRR